MLPLTQALPTGILMLFVTACALVEPDTRLDVEIDVADVEADGFMPVTISNTGSSSVFYRSCFVLQRWEGDGWEVAPNEPCHRADDRIRIAPGEHADWGIGMEEDALQDTSSEFRVWIFLADEDDEPLPDHLRGSEPFRFP